MHPQKADEITITKHMTQDQKDEVNKVFYKAKASKLASTFKYAMQLKQDPDGDTDELHKDYVKNA